MKNIENEYSIIVQSPIKEVSVKLDKFCVGYFKRLAKMLSTVGVADNAALYNHIDYYVTINKISTYEYF